MPTLFISRQQHDHILAAAPRVLQRAFSECVRRKYCLAGVTFYGLPEAVVSSINVILAAK